MQPPYSWRYTHEIKKTRSTTCQVRYLGMIGERGARDGNWSENVDTCRCQIAGLLGYWSSSRFCISDSCRCLTDCSTELTWASTLMRRPLREQWAVFNVLRSCALVKFARMVLSCSTAWIFSRAVFVLVTLSAYSCRRSKSSASLQPCVTSGFLDCCTGCVTTAQLHSQLSQKTATGAMARCALTSSYSIYFVKQD